MPLGTVTLGFCCACAHIFNLTFDATLVPYTEAYENSLHFSERFQVYARALARRLVDTYDLHDKDIIEIGCGRGEFLALLCDLGGNRGHGFDPSYAGGPVPGDLSKRITIVRSTYSERFRDVPADLVCCRHTLEHLEEPSTLLATVRRALGDRLTPVFFEVPDASAMIRDLAVWDVIYEHRSYFTLPSLVRAFEESGFEIRRAQRLFRGQNLGIDVRPRGVVAHRAAEAGALVADLARQAETFGERHRAKVMRWRAEVERLTRAGRRTVVWGAGSKGVTFLNVLGIRGGIDHVVDVNPRKQGRYVAGTGQQVVPPEFLRRYPADVVILMNSIYERECRRIAERLGLSPLFVCP